MPGILTKITKTIKDQQVPKKKQPWELMVVPFDKEPPRYVSKEERLTFKLFTVPSDPIFLNIELKSYAFNDGSPEE